MFISSLTILQSFPQIPSPKKSFPHPPPPIDHSIPWAFFDGVAQGSPSSGAIRGILHLDESSSISFASHLGSATNNYNKFMAVKLLITLAIEKGITHLNIYGDSMLVIK
jgi:ribonuclease HI